MGTGDELVEDESNTAELWPICTQYRVLAQWSRVYEAHLCGREIQRRSMTAERTRGWGRLVSHTSAIYSRSFTCLTATYKTCSSAKCTSISALVRETSVRLQASLACCSWLPALEASSSTVTILTNNVHIGLSMRDNQRSAHHSTALWIDATRSIIYMLTQLSHFMLRRHIQSHIPVALPSQNTLNKHQHLDLP